MSSSSSPATGSSQRTNIPKQAPLAQLQVHGAQTFSQQVLCPSAVGGVAQIIQGPNYAVPPGSSISFHSTSEAGVDDVLISESYEDLIALYGVVLRIVAGSSAVLPYAVDNLNQLWFSCGPNATHGGSIGIVVVTPAVS